MIKTRPEDVERDIVLPSLRHCHVYLEPSYYDKLSANLFVLFFTTNAVTSEREGRDYLFHRDSTKSRNELIANLRHSNFFWTGFTKRNVRDVISNGERYLGEESAKCTLEDRQLLERNLNFARFVLGCEGWKALSQTHELGLFVEDWPEEASAANWSLTSEAPIMIGVTQLLQAQAQVNDRILEKDPFGGLDVLGTAETAEAVNGEAVKGDDNDGDKWKKQSSSASTETNLTMGIPTSSLVTEPSDAKRHHQSATHKSPTKKRKATRDLTTKGQSRKRSNPDKAVVPADSPLRQPSIIGTASAKLSYLLEQIVRYQAKEKILIFYDSDNSAYYTAQCLELLHIPHLIYARSLKPDKCSRYIAAFDKDDHIRVLLMDVRCGAEGLNVNKASRVFFINPCCRPNMEAQAIKRSHRIGQTKPVHVETLILKGGIEEAIFKRAETMMHTEHQQANELQDDAKIASIIQNARSMPVTEADGAGYQQMARLSMPLQIFAREGRGNGKITGIDAETGADVSENKQRKRRKVSGGKNDASMVPAFRPPPPLLVSATAGSVSSSLFGGT